MSAETLERLAATIAARKGADPASSHTARLLAKGPEKAAEKFGEEAVEAIIEAVRGDRDRLIAEGADVLYHFLVMLAARGVRLDDVCAELARREGVSGVAEKAARSTAVVRLAGPGDLPACLAIRAAVFIAEQQVPRERELDGLDDECRHYLAEMDGRPVATARVRPLHGQAKIQRVAVLKDARGKGIGRALIAEILADMRADPDCAEAYIESQLSAVAFYESLGFTAYGEVFMDAGIQHRRLTAPLNG